MSPALELAAATVGWGGALLGGAHLAGLRGLTLGGRGVVIGAVLAMAGLGVGPGLPLLVGLPLGVAAVLARSATGRLDPDRPFREAQRPVGEGRARLGPARVSAPTTTSEERRLRAPSSSDSLPGLPGKVAGAEPGATATTARATVAYVVVHGGGNDRFYGLWYLYERLLGAGAPVEMVELPGHGRGGDEPFSLAAGRARVDAAVASVRADADRVVLLGQSMGAAFCLDAVARGTAADAAVAVSAPHSLDVGGAVLREARALLGTGLYRTLRYGSVREVLPAVGAFRREEFPVRVPADRDYVAVFKATLDEMALLDGLRGATVPVFVLHGEWDGVVPIDQARRIAAAAPGACLRVIPGGTHLDPLLDRGVVDDILAWVGQTPRRGGSPA